MSYEVGKSVCLDFLGTSSALALAINGAWGCGKTHLWNDAIQTYQALDPPPGLKKYAYVSLFGVRSIQELKALVLVRTRLLGKPSVNEAKKRKWPWSSKASNEAAQGAIAVANKTLGADVTAKLLEITENFIKDTVICFDDFERTDWGALSVEGILGFISDLKEQKGCKVVLIFNEERLDQDKAKSKFQAFREKVIDADLLLEPKPSEIIELSFDKAKPYFAIVEASLSELHLTNIRIHRRIRRLLDELYRAEPDLHISLMPSLVRALILYTAIIFDKSNDRPTLDFVRSYSAASRRGVGARPQGDQQSDWSEKLYAYGVREFDPLDECLVRFVERGYLQGTGVLEAICDWNTEFDAGRKRGAFDDAWRTFHDSLKDNEGELVSRLVESVKVAAKSISPNNFSTSLGLLRELGHSELLPELIATFIDQRRDEREVFELGHAPFSDQVYDDDLRKALQEHLAKIPVRLSLSDAAFYLIGRKESRSEAYAALNAATKEDIIDFLRSIEDSKLHSLVAALLDLRADQHLREVGDRVAEAVKELAESSPLNRLRLARHMDKVRGTKP